MPPTFGGRTGDGAAGGAVPEIEVRLADRSLRQTNPVMAVLAEVLELSTARLTASEVLDLAGREPVRRRFRFGDEDLSRLEEWVGGAGVRWGLDGPHRATFQLDNVGSNTWRAGLDRILLGVTMADERQRLFADTVPLDDVESADIELAGRMAEFIDRLRSAVDVMATSRPVHAWAAALAEISDSLSATSERDAWQRAELTGLLDELVDEATMHGEPSAVDLSCDDMRSILAARLKGRPTRANFCTGHLTICTLVPMRSIPHRVVCLLGLDDGGFPRHIERDGDDLTARDPRVGDRDIRGEDRQLLLDALLAAREHLLITYSGRDERSNQPRPPAVPVGELLDLVDHTVRTATGERPRASLIVQHPLLPFDRRNFEPGVLIPSTSWSFDQLQLHGARAALDPDVDPEPFLSSPLDEVASPSIGLDQLERFLGHPVRAFLRERLNVSFRDRTRDLEDAIPIEIGSLDEWQIGDRILQAELEGADPEACLKAEGVRGELPPGALAGPVLDRMEPAVEALVKAGRRAEEPVSLDVNVTLPDGTRVLGTVAGVQGDVVQTVTYSKLSARLRLISWLRLLALTAARPERAFEAVTIGRRRDNVPRQKVISSAHLAPLGGDAETRRTEALRHLEVIVDLYRRGMREPLPLYSKTSAAWAGAVAAGRDPVEAAKGSWDGREFDEYVAREHVLVLGGVMPFADMVSASGAPRADEEGAGWEDGESSRFGRYARRLWDAPLTFEELTDT